MNRYHPSLGILFVAGLFLTSSVSAQNAIEEVVIEAVETTNESIDDLVSVSALSADKLADAGIENVEDVAAYVPNLVLTETDTGTSIVIRGIGAGANQGFDQSVGLFMDGVPLPRSQMARAPFLDLQSVQVLRGPQYVRDGNYSIAGSVHLLSKDSSDSFEAGVDFNYVPSQSDKKMLLKMGLPLSDTFGIRVALQSNTGGGYIENVTRNEDGPEKDELISRVVFNFNPIDDLSMKLKVEKSRFKTTGRNIEIIQSRATPDFRDPVTGTLTGIQSVTSGGNTVDFEITRAPRARWSPFSPVAQILHTPFDDIFQPQRIPYDQGFRDDPSTVVPIGGNSDHVNNEENNYYFLGETYLGVFERQFQAANVALPAGFLDTSANFKRGADADEFSDNDSLNVTFNTELWLGETQLKFVASYIDYELEELIDSDFTALAIFETDQAESYEQEFYRIDFKTSEDSMFAFAGGLSYLQSELEFADVVRVNVDPVTDYRLFGKGEYTPLRKEYGDSLIAFSENTPLQTYLGRQDKRDRAVSSFGTLLPFREFNQSAETMAVFLESTIFWSDSFRSVIGMRYTHSEKSATRDVAFLTPDGRDLTDADVGTFLDANGNPAINPITNNTNTNVTAEEVHKFANLVYAQFFGIQSHSEKNIVRDANGNIVIDPVTGEPKIRGPGHAQRAISGTRKEHILLPSITLEWVVNEDLTLLGSVRTANKLGGFDARSLARPDAPVGLGLTAGTFEFEDEDAITYEVGAKWYMPDSRGEININLFHTKFEDLQTSVFDGKAGFNVINAGSATSSGVEIEGLLYVTDRLNINYSLAWIDFEFTDFDAAPCHLDRVPDYFRFTNVATLAVPENTFYSEEQRVRIVYNVPYEVFDNGLSGANANGEGGIKGDQTNGKDGPEDEFPRFQQSVNVNSYSVSCDFNGQTNQFVAEWQSTTSFNYEILILNLGMLKPTLDVIYNSGYHTASTQDPDVAQDEYWQFNGRLSLVSEDETWEVALTGQNLTNQKVISYANEVPFARTQGSKTHYGFVRPPRTIGLNFRYNFY